MKGVVSFIIIFLLTFFIAVTIFYLAIPLSNTFISEITLTGKNLINESIKENMPQELKDAMNESISGLESGQTILSQFVKYSWLIILIIVIAVLFIYAREIVEYRRVV